MKKLAIAVTTISALMAASTHAETVAETDALTLELNGELEVIYGKGSIKDADSEFAFDDVELGTKATYTNENGTEAFGVVEVDFGNNAEAAADLDLKKAFVGLSSNGATLTVGKQAYASDDLDFRPDYAFGTESLIPVSKGNEVVKASYEIEDMLTVSTSVDLMESVGDAQDEQSFDLYVEYTGVEGLTVGAAVQSYKAAGVKDDDREALNYVGFGAEYEMDSFVVATELTSDLEESDFAYALAGGVKLGEAALVTGGFGQKIFDDENMDALTSYYANATYDVHENASAFIEVGSTTKDDAELGYVVGMNVKF